MAKNPAEVLGINSGEIAIGKLADIIIWDPRSKSNVETCHTKYKETCPYIGQKLQGKIKKVLVGGKVVFNEGLFEALN
jgi:dihydroorotase